ncbi:MULTISPECIES: P-II family nitrogen regulator [unclassified Novosphingobium]|uniref:P-II family nitrogen regulator n=1 Tax=unclassified Novosphingobium TaxID=2644732 RepID=UPI00086E2B6F|nr:MULTISPECIES: P-II family nitrogen regulator [unclassified Novosphingobium]MBN9143140.1 P-II family nitrogen regulator [Novosphingobium sp.]MDR6706227.1 nitrogen regulatory protein P-II 1 [Novosphingobium sp. 1748]NKJ01093.1 nitrogen regulatory protein P-II 1 [Novosphingobium sp. SG707]ODU84738.1 MAG: hypothetical protein ABT10_00260 [Novosphingobium sp. SCN 63-17]OJX89482.1 MAG: hypothetical protein BGP00_14810 [Novosphingobium sp. 63-713]
MAMIEIRAVVRPSRLEMLRVALRQLPEFPGMTVARVEGCSGTGKLGNYPWTIKQELVDFTPKSMIHIVVDEANAKPIYDTIHQITRTARQGDGLIWTMRVEQCLFIAAEPED